MSIPNLDLPPLNQPDRWLALFLQPGVLLELAVLASCLGLAWGAVYALRSAFKPDERSSIWFGRRLVDGVLFPLLLLLLTFLGHLLWQLTGLEEAILRLALPVLVSLVVIRVGVKVLQVAFKDARWLRPIERSISWLVWLVLVLWVSGLLPLLLEELDLITFSLGRSRVSVRTLLEGVLTASAVLIVSLWVSSAVESRLLKEATGDELSLRKAASNAVRAVLLLLGLVLALSAVGIDLTALSVLGGALGVGIGFGLQKLAANYMSGFVILAERSIRIGDMVRIDNFEGRVTQINGRATVIRAFSGVESIVPNEFLMTNRIENLSLADSKIWQSTLVNVAYGSDVELVTRLLEAAAQTHERVLRDPAPAVALSAFGADGLEFTLGYWIADPENGKLSVRSAVNKAVLAALTAHGISIPYPQRVLHVV